jgi:hypothetical protein
VSCIAMMLVRVRCRVVKNGNKPGTGDGKRSADHKQKKRKSEGRQDGRSDHPRIWTLLFFFFFPFAKDRQLSTRCSRVSVGNNTDEIIITLMKVEKIQQSSLTYPPKFCLPRLFVFWK